MDINGPNSDHKTTGGGGSKEDPTIKTSDGDRSISSQQGGDRDDKTVARVAQEVLTSTLGGGAAASKDVTASTQVKKGSTDLKLLQSSIEGLIKSVDLNNLDSKNLKNFSEVLNKMEEYEKGLKEEKDATSYVGRGVSYLYSYAVTPQEDLLRNKISELKKTFSNKAMEKIQNIYLTVSSRSPSLEQRNQLKNELKELLIALDRSVNVDTLSSTQKGLIEGLGFEFGLVNVTISQNQKTAEFSMELPGRLTEVNQYFSFVLQHCQKEDINRAFFRVPGNEAAVKGAVDQIFSQETQDAKYNDIKKGDYIGILKKLLEPMFTHVVLDQNHIPLIFLTAAKIVANEDPSQIKLFNIYQGAPFLKYTCLKIEDELNRVINQLETTDKEQFMGAKSSFGLSENEKFRQGDLLKMLLDPDSITPPIDQSVLDRVVSLISEQGKYPQLTMLYRNKNLT